MKQEFDVSIVNEVGLRPAIVADVIYNNSPISKLEIEEILPYINTNSMVRFLKILEENGYASSIQDKGLDRTKTYFCTEKLKNIYKED